MTRRSLNDSPGDSFRTFCSDCSSAASRASTIRLRTPSCSMNAITSCCAPAPIDSIATTAATPKIIPSIVSSDRSLCARRFSRPSISSGRKSVDQRCVRVAHFGGPDAVGSGPADEVLRALGGDVSGSMSAMTSPSFEAGDRGAALGAVGDLDVARARTDRRPGGRRRSCRSSRTPPAAGPAARWESRGHRSRAARRIRPCRRGSGFSNVNVTSNCRTAVVSKKLPRDARPLSAPTFALNVWPGSASDSTVAALAALQVVAIGLVDLGADLHLAGSR